MGNYYDVENMIPEPTIKHVEYFLSSFFSAFGGVLKIEQYTQPDIHHFVYFSENLEVLKTDTSLFY